MAKKDNSSLFTSLLYIIIGALLVIFRSQALGWAMTFAGAIFVISGILDLTKKNTTGGAINLIIGLAILVLGWAAVQIVLLVLGILIAVKGILALIDILKRGQQTLFGLLFPTLTIAVGLLLAFGNGFDIIIAVTGILLIVDGIVGLFSR
jgi:uncharacterized membrane protein HdeD (DUF308 family)